MEKQAGVHDSYSKIANLPNYSLNAKQSENRQQVMLDEHVARYN